MKKLNLLWVLLVPVLFLFNACKEAPSADVKVTEVNSDSVKMQITEIENAYAVASNARDVDGVAAYYANDAESLAANEPTRVGMDAIKAGIKKDMDMDTTGATISFNVTGVWACGDYATETGTSTVKDKDGNVIRTGKYMTLFEKRNGKYVAIRDIWNSDSPRKDPM
jgi:ketosteroid isomerase-like protein